MFKTPKPDLANAITHAWRVKDTTVSVNNGALNMQNNV